MIRNKYQSRRFLFAVWACALATWIVLKNMTEWNTVVSALIAIVGAFILGESYTKQKMIGEQP